jgi:divalent metal cation (Fe/Co/Zn/Cd) transporter
VLLGAGGVALGFRLADPIIGLVITVAILGVLRSAAREGFARLMDAVDPDLSLRQAHDLAHHAERHLVRSVRRLSAVTIHISPSHAQAPHQHLQPDARYEKGLRSRRGATK